MEFEPKVTKKEEVKVTTQVAPKLDPKNLSGLTKQDFEETRRWFELEGKTDTTHFGS